MSKIPKLVVTKKPRSNFNLSRVNRFTAAPGIIYPVLVEEVLPDDTFKLDVEALLKTAPLLSPVLGSFKVNFHMFFAPTRLYSKFLSSNRVYMGLRAGLPGVTGLPFHTFQFTPVGGEDSLEKKSTVRAGSLLDFLGVPPGFVNMRPYSTDGAEIKKNTVYINANPMLAYYDIVRNYYAHQQSGHVMMFTDWGTSSSNPDGSSIFKSVTLEQFDGLFEQVANSDGLVINSAVLPGFGIFGGYSGEFAGLCCSTYMPDYFTQYLDASMVASFDALNRIEVNSDEISKQSFITVDQVRFANKMQRYLELSVLGGTRYVDWLRSNWVTSVPTGSVRPEYLGSTSTWLNFQDVVSTSNSKSDNSGGETGLGDLGGRGIGYGKGRKHAFHFSENGYFMVMMTIVPEVDYTQGIRKSLLKRYMSDLFVPALDGLGFQDISFSELCALPNKNGDSNATWTQPTGGGLHSDPFSFSVGKQTAWMEYMTAVNEAHGDLASGQDLNYWILSREFRRELTAVHGTTSYHWSPYINPKEFNHLFVDTSDYAQNFIVQCKFDLLAKRQISKNIRPNLG